MEEIRTGEAGASHRERAEALFRSGCNCAQSVFLAFSGELGMDRETALKLSAPFGGGMARMREVCGALTGMFLAAGLKEGFTDPARSEAKERHYEKLQRLAERFRAENGSILCRDLLRLAEERGDLKREPGTNSPAHAPSCERIVGAAAELLEREFASEAGGD